MAAVVILLAFFVVGFANNLYAWLLLHKAETSSFNDRKIVSLQLLLNIWNIITHAVAELSNQNIWFFLSTVSSLLSVYSLSALVLTVALGKQYSQSLNSKRFVTILLVVCAALFHFFGRRDLFCKNENCFSSSLAIKAEDEASHVDTVVVFTFIPLSVVIIASTYIGLQKYNRIAASKPDLKFLQVCSRVIQACPVLNFLLYGFLVIEVLLRYYDFKGVDLTPHHLTCRLICLDDHLYLLLSMFPVYMVHFIKRSKESLPKQSQET